MMSAFAELEANLLSERTKKGLEAARARGRKGGRPSLPDHKKREIKILIR
ncbi:putative site-specific recombinase [Staphylococcus xylosus]|nr:putative site-specific recombinase [Staphylococcus xylosus]